MSDYDQPTDTDPTVLWFSDGSTIHSPNATRPHGTHRKYVLDPCRCDDCRSANRRYEQHRSRRATPAYVGADRARQHITHLQQAGVGLKTVAARSGISHGTLTKLIYGTNGRPPSRRIRHTTESAILSVTPADIADGGRVDAAPTWQTIQQLLDRGWTKVAIARAIGQKSPGLQLSRNTVTARHARAVTELLDQPVPPRHSRWGAHSQEQHQEEDDDGEDRSLPPDPIAGLMRLDERPGDWIAQAACRHPHTPTWLFYPGRGDNETLNAAKKVCDTCPVRAACLDYALDGPEKLGVWGGASERERQQLRRTNRKTS